MALDRENLLALMKTAAKVDSKAASNYSYNGESFSAEKINDTLRSELNAYADTPAKYRENKNFLFALIEETIDEVLPKKAEINYAQFAEVKNYGNADRPIFRRRIDYKTRAKQFITRVGLAGVYEVFKLGKTQESFEVPTSAIGGAASVGFEEFLDGRVDFAELTAIVMDGMDELIYKEIAESMKSAINQLPTANRAAAAGFVEASFDKLLQIAESYGTPTIYCTHEFAVKLVPGDQWKYSDDMKNELWKTGRLGGYKGFNVVVLPQSFTDATHTEKLIDPKYVWIIPNGANTKPVKVAFQGGTYIRDVDSNHDWSKEFHVYKKVGVVCMMTPDICVYTDTSLKKLTTGEGYDWTIPPSINNDEE